MPLSRQMGAPVLFYPLNRVQETPPDVFTVVVENSPQFFNATQTLKIVRGQGSVRLGDYSVRRFQDGLGDRRQVSLKKDSGRKLPFFDQFVHGSRYRGLGSMLAFLKLEQNLADRAQIVADGVLNLLKSGDGFLGIDLQPLPQRLQLQHCPCYRLGQAVMDAHGPTGPLLEHEVFHRVGYGGMRTLPGCARTGAAGNAQCRRPFDRGRWV
jgi:hypothetical protein